jgi:DNA-binding NarL/FixJ family response regulator
MNHDSNNNNSALRTPHSALIRVLLVDDSLLALTLLKRMLATAPDIEVVGTATNGREALELIPRLNPAIVCTDIHMPVMDGLVLTSQIMEKNPRPILVVSVSVYEGSLNAFKILSAGALDLVSKPQIESEKGYNAIASELISKIRVLSGVRVFRRIVRERTEPPPSTLAPPVLQIKAPVRIVVIGASTGGPPALQAILTRLPPHFPLPIVCVQHISKGFQEGLLQPEGRGRPRGGRAGAGDGLFPPGGKSPEIRQGWKVRHHFRPPLPGAPAIDNRNDEIGGGELWKRRCGDSPYRHGKRRS